ncbi:MAG TPA: hypothetical protein VFT00_05180 [Nocardioides sp.]|nr:hypothetical protein [Nocardioides sp.]
MPRNADTLDDRTPLTASRIDIAARIGWLLRTSRSVAGLSLREMSTGLKAHDVALSTTSLSRIESEGHRSPGALDGYTRVLGLPDGTLRSSVDLLCRSFSYAPAAPPEPAMDSLERFSESYEAVTDRVPTGGDWLRFARQHTSCGAFGLPRTLMEPMVARMAGELGRSIGTAERTRYEALALLRCSAYADLVDSVLREMILDPDVQLMYYLTSVLSENPTPALLQWAGEMLGHESILVAQGSSYALQSMLVVGGLRADDWDALVPHFTRAWGEGDATRRAMLTQLCSALPPAVQSQIRDTCPVEAELPRGPRVFSRSRRNAHYGFARSIAAAACAQLGHPEEPLLERLLFEALFDPRGVRMVTSTFLIASSPFAAAVVPLLVERREHGPDAASREAALRLAAALHGGEALPVVDPLLESTDATEFEHAAVMVGHSGRHLPQAILERGLSGDRTTVRRTLYAAGMAEDPRLAAIASDRGRAASTRRAARWWIDSGGRILD